MASGEGGEDLSDIAQAILEDLALHPKNGLERNLKGCSGSKENVGSGRRFPDPCRSSHCVLPLHVSHVMVVRFRAQRNYLGRRPGARTPGSVPA